MIFSRFDDFFMNGKKKLSSYFLVIEKGREPSAEFSKLKPRD